MKTKDEEVSLKDYFIIICEMGTRGNPHLSIRLMIDLSDGIIPLGHDYGLISNDLSLPSVIPRAYSPNVWKIFGRTDKDHWLDVAEENFLAIFLVYGRSAEMAYIFTQTSTRYFALLDNRLSYLQTNVLDYLVVTSSSRGPRQCPLVDDVFSLIDMPTEYKLDSWLQEHNKSPGFDQSLSIAKCGSNNR